MASYLEQRRQQWTYEAWIRFWSCCLHVVYTTSQENQLKNPSIQVNKDEYNTSIQVNKDEYNKDKKFSPKITSPALELTNIQDGNIGLHL